MLAIQLSSLGLAYDFKIDGIYYIVNDDRNSVSVCCNEQSQDLYSGNIVIPEFVFFEGARYKMPQFSYTEYEGWTYDHPGREVNSENIISNRIALYVMSNGKVLSLTSPAFSCHQGDTIIMEVNWITPQWQDSNFNLDKVALTAAIIEENGSVSDSITFVPTSVSYSNTFNLTIIASKEITSAKVRFTAWNADSQCYGAIRSVKISDIVIKEDTFVVNAIDNNAFEGCSNLKKVKIPRSMKTIRTKAFYNCSGLESVYSFAEIPPVIESRNCFTSYNTAILYVPYQYLDIYKNTNYWKDFYDIYGVDAEDHVLVEAITLNESSLSLVVNQTLQLTATVYPGFAANKTVTWESSDTAVAIVDHDGLVTARTAGTATIKAITTDGSNLSASCEVTVSIIPVTSVTLSETSLNLDVGDSYQLTTMVLPNNATYRTLSWSSSNPGVATVSSSGVVMPISPGDATIIATTTDGTNLSASCHVTVVKLIKSITLNESSLTLTLPQTTQLAAVITPNDATNQALTWTSSNTSVAMVDANGFVTSKSVGNTIIKAASKDGTNLSASCQVTVKQQYVTSISLNETNLVMNIGDSFQLIPDIQPENASYPTLSWSTGNSSVATVDNNGLVTAIAGGTTYIKASATDGSYVYSNCIIEVVPDYYITLDTLSHVRGTAAQIVELPVTLVNKNPISGIQFDVSLPTGVEFNLVDGLPDVWLDEARGTRSHSISACELSNGKYRVLVTSSTSKNLRGNNGVLVHMNMLLPQIHDAGNYSINVSNIIASEADETRHTLENKSTIARYCYIVGDADANAVVDIADHTATASKIMGKSPSPFYYDAANVDGNNSLDVVDLVGITNIALDIKPITIRQAPRRGDVGNRLFCDRLKLNAGGEQDIVFGLECGFAFAGFQIDLTMPHGLTLVDAKLGDKASKLGLVTEMMSDDKIRILGTSFSDADVEGVCDKLLILKVKAEGDYIADQEIEFSDIIFAERDLTVCQFDGSYIEFNEQSSVYELMDDARIYVENGNIIVDTPIAGTIQLISVDGCMVECYAQVGHNVYSFNLTGFYIIHFNNKTLKVRL